MNESQKARLLRLLQAAPLEADEATRAAWLAQLNADDRQALEALALAWLTEQLAHILPPGGLHGHLFHPLADLSDESP